MIVICFLKICSDLGMFLSLTGFILAELGASPLILLGSVPAVGAVFTLSSLLAEKRLLRFGPLLLLLPGFFLLPLSAADLVCLLSEFLYCAWLIGRKTYYPEWSAQTALFSVFWKILAGLIVVEAVFDWNTTLAMTLPAGLLALGASVLLTRALRHEESVIRSWRFELLNFAGVAALLGAALIIGSPAVMAGLLAAVKWFYLTLISPVLMGAVYIMIWLIKGIAQVFSFIKIRRDESLMPSQVHPSGEPDTEWDEIIQEESPFDIRILYAILILIGLAILFFILWKLAKSLTRKGAAAGKAGETRTILPAEKKEARPPRGPVRDVREIYRKFLRFCRQRSVELLPSDTSLDVEQKSRPCISGEEEKKLRELYLKARYREEAGPEDAAKAKTLFAAIRRKNP